MLASIRALSTALLAVASLAAGITPVLAETMPPGRTACAGAGHAHRTPTGTPSVHEGRGGCGQCEHGCGPGQCITPASLAVAMAEPASTPQRPHGIHYDLATDPLRSASATPPIPPPQPGL